MNDEATQDRIERLIEEEQALLRSGQGQGPSDEREAKLEAVKVELDRCWDLLRQRRARDEFGQDPDEAEVRDADTVERYLQ